MRYVVVYLRAVHRNSVFPLSFSFVNVYKKIHFPGSLPFVTKRDTDENISPVSPGTLVIFDKNKIGGDHHEKQRVLSTMTK